MSFELFNFFTILLLILIIIPILIYLICRLSYREKLTNKHIEIPSNDPPALINSLFGKRIYGEFGEINIGSFYLTILDLINRKYISVKVIKRKFNLKKDNKSDLLYSSDKGKELVLDKIILKINNKNIDNLPNFEKNVLKCLNALECQGVINLLIGKKLTTKRLKVKTFQKNYDEWIKNFYEDYFNDLNLFNKKFDKFLSLYGMILVFVFIVTAVYFIFEGLYLNLIISFLGGILGAYLMFNPPKSIIWTKETKKQRVKWDSFKKYYEEKFKAEVKSQEFLDSTVDYIPILLAMGVSRSVLLKSFTENTNIPDTYLFLKYGKYSIIKDIVEEFLKADGSFDHKYYNTSGNFVPGFG